MTRDRHVYFFGAGHADGTGAMKDILGGKGAGLAEMTTIGIPVPPGFTISAKVCASYLETGHLPDYVVAEVRANVERLEQVTGKAFGDPRKPLLVSVRSGAKDSMPGMMETILNLGLNPETVEGLAKQSGNARLAYDCYRRFIQMFGDVVYGNRASGGTADAFETALEGMKRRRGVARDIDLSPEDLEQLTTTFKDIIHREVAHAFPDDPWDQLLQAIGAVFGSWNIDRAVDYRRVHGISNDLGTAVNIVAMVFGNMGEDSGTGVAFTRDPATGEKTLYGEFLANAQGEDVVAGTRDPQPLSTMRNVFPETYEELEQTATRLEAHFRDVQDIEFTIERGKLYLLQTRGAKRTAQAAVRTAVEMVDEGLIDRAEALQRVDPRDLDQFLHPTVDPGAIFDVLTTGLPASPGAAVGMAVFDADTAERRAEAGAAVILVRRETSPDDFHGMVAAQAILTARGGMTSHAAVVARGMGKCCVAGAKEIDVDEAARQFSVNGNTVREGDWLTLDGSLGQVISGRVKLVEPKPSAEFTRLMTWADDVRTLRVRANADTPADAERARDFGAEGIGLCRTEHMFFEEDRIRAMREMILAANLEGRRRALVKLLPMQREDFAGIFRTMDGYPVTIRLLDPPLHEFLPREERDMAAMAAEMDLPLERLRHTVEVLTEANPMLGHRGCRLGITYPEITEMQSQAIFEAACEVAADGLVVYPEVMVPLVSHVEELRRQIRMIRDTAERVFSERKRRVEYLVGTMIELPRAALTADRIAEVAEFFSFGTNDLTQTTLGLSRDDAGRFLPYYVETGIYRFDPFESLDTDGVGKLLEIGVRLGRQTKRTLKIGICGEHGGDPQSVAFCHRTGFDYVSCSPFRVPIARLSAARAALDSSRTS